MKRTILLLLLTLFGTVSNIFGAKFISSYKCDGVANKDNLYVYNNSLSIDTSIIEINKATNNISIDGISKYEILDIPEHWTFKDKYKYADFGVISLDGGYDKCFVRVIFFYNNEKYEILFKTKENAVKYFIQKNK